MPSQPEQKTSLSRPELLSPAGDWDSLLAAVANGADAVYLGTKEFNARANARNFSFEELDRAVKYCHRNGVRVYLTANILVKNHELGRFFNVISQAYSLGIDGVIIQHVSFLEIIKGSFPGLKVFLSTQAAIGNAASALLFKSADRVILPRELTLEEVKEVVRSGVRAEVFVHGALCFSYSGLCLFSSFVGDRSGNRGSCAQLCRQKYNGTYPLSTRELCLVRRIPELIQAGVTGFKIEGRMRSPLYVAVATRLYRKAIDAFLAGKFAVPEKELAEIEVVFNREFTEGLMFSDKNLVSPEKPMNRGALLGVIESGEITLRRPVAIGDGVGVWGKNGVTGTIVKEISLDGKQVSSAAAGQKVNFGVLAADGTKIYLTSSASIDIKPDFDIVRTPVAEFQRKRIKVSLPEIAPRKVRVSRLLVKAYSLTEARDSLQASADLVFYNIFASDFPGPRGNSPIGAYLPRIMNDAELSQALTLLSQKKPAAILTGNLGFLQGRSEFDVPVYLDYSANCFNDIDVLFFQRFGAIPMLSPELSLKEMTALQNKDVVILCHGDIVLVNTLIPISEKRLVDEKGYAFPVRQEGRYWQILNSRPFGLFNDIRALRAAGFNQFLIDKSGKGASLTELYRNILNQEVNDRRLRKGHTSGHLYRPVR